VQSFRNGLLQRGSPAGSQVLPANLLQHGLLSPWVRRTWQEPAPAQAPHGVTASFRHPPAPAWGLFHGLQVDIHSPWTFMDCRGTACLTMVFITSCRGRHSALTFRTPSPPSPSSLTLVSAELLLSHRPTPLYPAVSLLSFFLPFLKDVITEVLPPSLIGLALGSGGSILEPAGTAFIRHGGSFSQKPPL